MNGGIGDDLDFPAIPCDEDDIDLVLKHVVDLIKGSNTLIILDDCASGQDIKKPYERGGQTGVQREALYCPQLLIIITQQLTSVAKPYRENISKLVVFNTSSW